MSLLRKFSYFLVFLIFFCFNTGVIGQNKTLPNSFVIHGVVTNEQRSFYTKSIENTDMEQFRLKTEKVVLKFKNGFLLELLSAKELSIKNSSLNIDINKYSDQVPTLNYKHPIFQILESGWVTAEIQNNSKQN